jgi:hypothetical protein
MKEYWIGVAAGAVAVGLLWFGSAHSPHLQAVEADPMACLTQRVEALEHRAAVLERRMIERVKKEAKP